MVVATHKSLTCERHSEVTEKFWVLIRDYRELYDNEIVLGS